MLGQTISHYKVLEKIGEGGMGVVYKAQDVRLDRLVALKFLPSNLVASGQDVARFQQEAKAISALNHPNIATLYDIGEAEGQKFIVLEYLPGDTLKSKVKQIQQQGKELSIEQILDYAIQIAEGLSHAHKQGIVHRDVKTDNVMLTAEGKLKLTDFGLAKLKGVTKLTKTGSTLGTIAYMSSEQAQGEEVHQRSDIFSLGVVLYELVAGRLPFSGEHDAAIVYSICNEDPEPLVRYKKDVPEGLQRIANKALKKEKTVRYQNVSEVCVDLRELRDQLSTGQLYLRIRRKMLAVLPFENRGSVDDEYFAEGITDHITTSLAKISALGIISRTSCVQYRKTEKRLRQIGSELGVDYVLEGSVYWDKLSVPNRVRINCELVRVDDEVNIWAQSYEQVFEKVFDVQSNIAERVTSTLDVLLLDQEHLAVTNKPTNNPDAYVFFLRGNNSLNKGLSEKDFRDAINMYEKAVEFDPNFTLAHAMVSIAHAKMYFYFGRGDECRVKAKTALDKAIQLGPAFSETHLSMGYYHYLVNQDYDLALQEFIIAQNGHPNNSDLFFAVAAVQRRQGKWEHAVVNFTKAAHLDPRSAFKALELGTTYHFMKKYPLALEYYDSAISLAPDWAPPYSRKAGLYINWEGNTEKARNVLRAGSAKADKNMLSFDWMECETLDGDYQAALDLLTSSEDFVLGADTGKTDVGWFFINKAQTYGFLRESQFELAYYDSARNILESEVLLQPNDPSVHMGLALAYAGLGRKEEAIQEGGKALELAPVSKDPVDGPTHLYNMASVHVKIENHDPAIDILEFLLNVPQFLVSSKKLRIDPTWAPLRTHPRFQKLLAAYK